MTALPVLIITRLLEFSMGGGIAGFWFIAYEIKAKDWPEAERSVWIGLLSKARAELDAPKVSAVPEKRAATPPPAKAEVPKGPRAIIKTKYGEMEIRFFPNLAPKHVENFVKLAREGFYNGTIFHRVLPGLMIQGGDPYTKDAKKKDLYGPGGPGYTIKAEFNDTAHKRGIVSMARAQDPDSAGSQFFIVVEDSLFWDRKWTAFGEVVKGIEVADKIVNVPRSSQDLPNERIEMTVAIVE